MATFINLVKNSWIFRNTTNLLIFTTGVTSTSYFVVQEYKKRSFEHPVIDEALMLLQKNEQIVELIGYPIQVYHNHKNHAVTTDFICNFSFVAFGPKGSLNIELAGNSMSMNEIQSGKQRSYQIEEGDKLKQVGNDGSKDPLQLQQLYNIPSSEVNKLLQKNIHQPSESLQQIKIEQDHQFWAIDYLYADIADDFRIVVRPNDDPKSSTKALPHFRKNLVDIMMESGFKQGKSINKVENLSPEEIEEMRKFRQNQTYQKIGYARFYISFIAVMTAMSTYTYLIKNKRKNILGTELHTLIMNTIKKDLKIKKFYGHNIKFEGTVRGAIVGNQAQFEQDFHSNQKNAVLINRSVFDKKLDQWVIEELIVKEKVKGQFINDIKII